MAEQDREMTRRVVMRGAALTAVAAPLLAACGSGGDTTDSAGSGSDGGGTAKSSSGGSASGSAKATVATSAVPVDGGKILAEEQVVVTQPAQGDFKAFSAVCTHQGCTVQSVTDGKIMCPCHGSQFSIKDGSVVQGPATQPLPSYACDVQGGTVTVS